MSNGRRFAQGAGLNPQAVKPLRDDHPAIAHGRPLFPRSVVHPDDSPRLLVSGKNSIKLGEFVTKGPLKGFPIYALTLPERTTCPRSCHVYNACFGNSMPFARRHAPGERLEKKLLSEMGELARRHPTGFLVRVHALGDFYSLDYVAIWELMLSRFPMLYVFGYTACLLDAVDDRERSIAEEIAYLKLKFGTRFYIRWSRKTARGHDATIIDRIPQGRRVPEGIVCPAETSSVSCGECTLCWSPAAFEQSIVFVLHGMGTNTGQHGAAQYKREKKLRNPRPAKPPSVLGGRRHSSVSGEGNQASVRKAQKAGTVLGAGRPGSSQERVHEPLNGGSRRSSKRELIPGVGYAPLFRRTATGFERVPEATP